MSVRRYGRTTGFTLIELMVAMAIMAVATLGALSYQYHAAHHAKLSDAEIAGTRIAQLLLEDWKANGGSEHYDPADLKLGFVLVGSDKDADYSIVIDDTVMYVDLSYSNVATDSAAGLTLRQITIRVRWRADHGRGPALSDDRSVLLTTFVRRDSGS